MAITRDMSIIEILRLHPEAVKVFQDFQMGCIGCMGAASESVEKGAIMHGVNVDELIDNLNKFVDAK